MIRHLPMAFAPRRRASKIFANLVSNATENSETLLHWTFCGCGILEVLVDAVRATRKNGQLSFALSHTVRT